ncbi:hypothetical protein RHGRI_019097 [Rhododendron griersonianum]|uniref:Pentatricopeptide repeat-containing protein n=1 Tax=Rhododendron griersonianum TaxID=479676 RepID=A0AAV6JDF6_9ERIC|nr:hypothetical protein RHGRI_019097 [Rhododendron griersonianum]
MSQVFDEMDAFDIDACSAFVGGLSRNGFVDEARMVFMQFRQRDRLELVYWTSLIAACSQNGKDMEALDLFRDMLRPHMIRHLSFSTLGFVISVSRRRFCNTHGVKRDMSGGELHVCFGQEQGDFSCCKIVVDGAWKAGRCQGIAAWCALTEEFGLDRKGTSLVSASSATMVEGIAALQALIRWAKCVFKDFIALAATFDHVTEAKVPRQTVVEAHNIA